MKSHTKRKHPRTLYDAPIEYTPCFTDTYRNSMMYNYCRNGLYFQPAVPLDSETTIYVTMENYSPGKKRGPEAFRSYIGVVRWCKQIDSNGNEKFGAGVKLLVGYHEKFIPLAPGTVHVCDLCGKIEHAGQVHCTESFKILCLNCYRHLAMIPDGHLKRTIERYIECNYI